MSEKRTPARRKLMKMSDNRSVNIHGKSKGNVGARLVIENMCNETWCHYSELLWEDPHHFEHAVLSVYTENQKYFQESLNLNKEGNKKLNDACTFVYGSMMDMCKQFGEKKGSICRSFMAMVHKFQTDENSMKTFVEKLPAALKENETAKPNIYHRLLVDYVASYFQHEFILTIDRIKASNETLEENTAGSNLINEILMAHQANTDKIIDTPITEEESIAEVHKFVGHAVSKAKSEYHELESELIDDKVSIGTLLEEMTCTKEELKEDEVKKYYPRIMHLKSMKQREAVSNGLEKVLMSPSFFDFGLTLLDKENKRARVSRHNQEGRPFGGYKST